MLGINVDVFSKHTGDVISQFIIGTNSERPLSNEDLLKEIEKLYTYPKNYIYLQTCENGIKKLYIP